MSWSFNKEYGWWYDESSEEALAYRWWSINTMEFRTVEEARKAFSDAQNTMNDMDQNLSGCDWCCGGGDIAYGEESRLAEKAQEWLKKRGESIAFTPLCTHCNYAAGTKTTNGWWSYLCAKCEEHLNHQPQP
jgi:hypothetical protein